MLHQQCKSKSKQEIQQEQKQSRKKLLKEQKEKVKTVEDLKNDIRDFVTDSKGIQSQEIFLFLSNLNNDKEKVMQAFLESLIHFP